MLAAVDDVLAEIGAGERPRLLALNKVDLLERGAPARAVVPVPRRRPGVGGDGRGARRAARGDRGALPRHACARWSCSCPTTRAAACRSCTSWPASSSGRTPPTGVRVRARVPGVGGAALRALRASTAAPARLAPVAAALQHAALAARQQLVEVLPRRPDPGRGRPRSQAARRTRARRRARRPAPRGARR